MTSATQSLPKSEAAPTPTRNGHVVVFVFAMVVAVTVCGLLFTATSGSSKSSGLPVRPAPLPQSPNGRSLDVTIAIENAAAADSALHNKPAENELRSPPREELAADGSLIGVRVVVDSSVRAGSVTDGNVQHMVTQQCEAGTQRRRAPLLEEAPRVIASSALASTGRLIESTNGFVTAVMTAYNNHLPLRLKPDDIWINVLLSVSAYIDKHAER